MKAQKFTPEQLRLLTYNANDAAITYEVANAFWHELHSGQHEDTYETTIELLKPLMFMMTRGIRVDQARLEVARRETNEQIDKLQEQLNELVGRELNPNSPKQVATYFYVEKGITPYKNSEGRPSTDDKALTRLARGTSSRRPLPEAKLIQQLRGLHKLRGTYLEMEFDSDNRFRTSCNPRGTKFGRISTGQTIYGTGMNMQNLPESFKRFLMPDEGYLLVEMDKRQAEWVVVAYDCGDANMISILEQGGDPHTHTAHLMFGASKELIEREKKIIGHSTDPFEIERLRREHCPEIFDLPFVPRMFSLRQAGKKSNHALNYDETYKRFAFENEMPERESKIMVERYHRIYPGIRTNYKRIQDQLQKDRTLTNCFGRRCKFLEKWGSDLFKQAYAFKPQSTVADVVNHALIEIYNTNEPLYQSIELLAQVHDSILFQVPLSLPATDILACICFVEDCLYPTLSYWGRDFHIETDIKLGTCSWGELPEEDLSNKNRLLEIINEHKEAAK